MPEWAWWTGGIAAVLILISRIKLKRPAWYGSESDLPTDKQLNFIDRLIEERQAEDMEGKLPATIEDASAMIDELLERPRRYK